MVFEKPRDLLEINNQMREFNSASLMSGSGATIFGIFENKNDLEDAYRNFKKTYDKTFKLKVGEKFGSF